MRNFSVIGSYEKTKEFFSFLVSEYQYSLIQDENLNYGFTLEYQRDEIRVHLFYDYRANSFNFYLIRGKNTKYPNDYDSENIRPFYELFQKFDESLDIYLIDPSDDDYEPALNKNQELLKKYGEKVLRGIEWV